MNPKYRHLYRLKIIHDQQDAHINARNTPEGILAVMRTMNLL